MNAESVLNNHNPENDAGKVTWADVALAEDVQRMKRRIEQLESQIDELRNMIAANSAAHPADIRHYLT